MIDPLVLLFVIFGVVVILGVPVAVSLGISALIVMIYAGFNPVTVVTEMFRALDSFTLLAVPLFLTAGFLVTRTSIGTRLLELASLLVERIRGGLGHVNVLVSMMFAGLSGSATADTSGIGAVVIPMMRRRGYPAAYAAALTAASSTIGLIIPPSLYMVVYGAFASTSVGALFIAGVVPGILIGAGFMAINYVYAVRNEVDVVPVSAKEKVAAATSPANGPRIGAAVGPTSGAVTVAQSSGRPWWRVVLRGFPSLGVPFVIILGISAGFFTPTEAGIVALLYLGILAGVFYRELRIRLLRDVARQSVLLYSLPLLAVATAGPFGWLLAMLGAPATVRDIVSGLDLGPFPYLLLVIVFFTIIGTFLDGIPAIVIFAPLFVAGALEAGVHPVHLGIVVSLVLAMSMVTPPYGLCLLIASKLAGVRLAQTIRAILPFWALELAVIVLVAAWPTLVLALPQAIAPDLF